MNGKGSDSLAAFGAVVLAAGQSSRMGGPNKLLTPYEEQPLAHHAFARIAGLGLGDAVCVTGRDAEAIGGLATSLNLRCVHNPGFAAGMGTSIAIGVRALRSDLSGIFIVLGDMPRLTAADFASLAAAMAEGGISVPVFHGRRGHPVLFAASYRPDLEKLAGDNGAKAILREHGDRVIEVPVANSGVLFDCDTLEDFGRSPAPAA